MRRRRSSAVEQPIVLPTTYVVWDGAFQAARHAFGLSEDDFARAVDPVEIAVCQNPFGFPLDGSVSQRGAFLWLPTGAAAMIRYTTGETLGGEIRCEFREMVQVPAPVRVVDLRTRGPDPGGPQ